MPDKVIENSYYKMRQDFYEAFREKISPKLKSFEDERLKKRKLAIAGSIVCVILAIITGFLTKAAVPVVLFAIGAFLVPEIVKKSFENKIKTRIMPLICSLYGDLWWDRGKYSGNISMLNDSCLIPRYDSSSYDDIFAGSYKGVPFEMIEASYTKTEGTGKNRRTVTVFDGVIIKLKMNKNFDGHTLVKADSMLHISPARHLKHTELEDVNFEKKFDVFSDDEIEARYLLTPVFMEKLTGLRCAFSSNVSSCAFYKDYFFLALSTSKDLFSIGSLSKPADDFGQFEILHNEIISLFKIIDYFKMNEKTGL